MKDIVKVNSKALKALICNIFCSSEQMLVFKGVHSIRKQIEDTWSTSFPVLYCRMKKFVWPRYIVCVVSTSKQAWVAQAPCSCKRYNCSTMNSISLNQNCCLDKLLQSQNTPSHVSEFKTLFLLSVSKQIQQISGN